MKITTAAASLCITAGIGIYSSLPRQPLPFPVPRGYTDGKQCYYANGCATVAKFSQCIDCCSTHCPYPWNAGCIDECIGRFDPKDVYAAMVEATKTISNHEGGEAFDQAKTILAATQHSSDTRIARVARMLAIESEDYSGISGIYVKR